MDFNDVKIVFLDLDGTLLDDNKIISEVNKKELKRLIAQNIIICYDSGCSINRMQKTLKQFMPNGPLITYNGVKIYDNNFNVIYHQLFSKNECEVVIKYCLNNDLNMIIWSNDLIYTSKLNDKTIGYSQRNSLEAICLGLDIKSYQNIINSGVDKILIYEDNRILQKVKDDLMYLKETNIAFSDINYLEFFHKNASKGEAVKIVCEYLNISIDYSMGFGDQNNDEAMLDIVKYPIVMGQSKLKDKNKYLFVTSSNNDDGVAKILNNIKGE